MKPENLVEKLKKALPSDLRAVVLYGSAAAGDHVDKHSDYNVLVVTENLGLPQLKALSKPSLAWMKAGNPAPLLFTLDRLKKSADVFPIEILDIKQSHKILYGDDIISQIEISQENLRLELEHELKGKLIQLRERYLATGGKPKLVCKLMMKSLSTFLVLFRAALRLYEDEVPEKKIDVLDALSQHIRFDTDIFSIIEDLRTGVKKMGDVSCDALFERYLKTVEEVVDAVDDYLHQSDGGKKDE